MKDLKSIFLKLTIMIILVSLATIITSNPVKAGFWDTVFKQGEVFVNDGKAAALEDNEASNKETSDIITILYNVLLTLGVIVSIAVGGVLGIKFMTASAEDKAKIKESMVPYVAGCIVIFGAFTIWKICIRLFSQI